MDKKTREALVEEIKDQAAKQNISLNDPRLVDVIDFARQLVEEDYFVAEAARESINEYFHKEDKIVNYKNNRGCTSLSKGGF